MVRKPKQNALNVKKMLIIIKLNGKKMPMIRKLSAHDMKNSKKNNPMKQLKHKQTQIQTNTKTLLRSPITHINNYREPDHSE